MANTSAPFGFQLAGTLDGTVGSLGQQTRLIANGYTTPIYSGDPVVSKDTGYIQVLVAGSATPAAGIFAGCTYLNTSLGRTVWSPSWPGSGATGDVTAYVITNTNATFLVQATTTAGQTAVPITIADIGNNIDIAIGTGNTTTGQSGASVNTYTIGTTNTLPFRIVSLVTSPPGAPGTDATSAYNRVIVAFNNQDFKQLTGV
jgi:hypothetical protein